MDASVKPLNKNDVRVCEITGYTSEGMGVARIGGRAVFIPGGARGDTCLVRATKVSANVAYGRIERIETPSPHRVTPDCPAFPRCGGCQFRHISYGEELRAKKQRAEETLARIGGISLAAQDVFAAPELDGYRNKASFPVGRDAGGVPVTGFYRERTHDIVPVETCRLQSAEANACAKTVREWMTQTGRSLRHIVTRGGDGGILVCLVSAYAPDKSAARLAEMLRRDVPGLCGAVWQEHAGQDNVILGGRQSLLWGSEYVRDELCGLEFRLSVQSFYQINKRQAGRMYARVLEYAGEYESLLDLYCGAGTMTLMAARARPGAKVFGAEIVPEAVSDARENAARNSIENAGFILGDAGEAAAHFEANPPDVILLDPPRKGVSPETAAALLRIRPARIVYLSCDPATLARDLKLLCAGGYAAESLTVADFFPRTAHVECAVKLVRKQ
ncbi:MAG: 23S rRNA (uracil(1939)-C(5))-methyltransferase RlmD [Oscillospiraceae bacterium]|jgi:23S rRNA (uracil1939-C5)-methyltransferase|nr:23S rRNA (uracil(1939)-C(5))-methyltransferase RlmD [Oscillospiraceae bacterium]